MASASKKPGFDLTCPKCHSEDDTITIDLNDLTECRCTGCDETFSPREAREMVAAELAKWDRLINWLELAPGVR